MEFAKYYNVTDYFNKLVNDNKIVGVGEIYKHGYFVCEDVNDFHIIRIHAGVNSKYEEEQETKLTELYDISKSKFNKYVLDNDLLNKNDRYEIDKFVIDESIKDIENRVRTINITSEILNRLSVLDAIDTIIQIDYDNGFENYDAKEYRYDTDIEEIYDDIDGGYGILDLQVV